MKKKAFLKNFKFDTKISKIFLSALKGFFILLLICLLNACLFFSLDLDFKNLYIFTAITYAVSSLAAGYFSGKAIKEKGALCGIASGMILFILCLIISAFVNPRFDANLFLKLAITLIAGCTGGILGINKRNRKKIKAKK